MSGVWFSKNTGVIRLVENPSEEEQSIGRKRKVLVHLPTQEIVSSYNSLEKILTDLGWEKYDCGDDPDFYQFHKKTPTDLSISLPKDFAKFNTVQMYDIVFKTRHIFHVRYI
ncbi:flowering-promoting factor 1-like [Nicotiana sylvestris]|uniref:Flowering-promoting factor 1-like n=2 Tax=Nicotiana TaxID=4085 RepID=A0A1S3XGE2_TOBAC|nr:PREDICTED: flowering-promoting factor 1-like [Nicotiana sylvestris]XP_016439005.1 PREDICTED: flowering-promoting factor 1-like [Nicotiana tabacum]